MLGAAAPDPVPASRPAWGEWIEIVDAGHIQSTVGRLAPHGASGLKSGGDTRYANLNNVSPRMGRVD